jgi:hypothetical protein
MSAKLKALLGVPTSKKAVIGWLIYAGVLAAAWIGLEIIGRRIDDQINEDLARALKEDYDG